MTKKQKAEYTVHALKQRYPKAQCSLLAEQPWQLLIATRLSAQCTDSRVNLVTPELFRRFPTPELLGSADIAEVEQLIHSCGLYKTKARDIVSACGMLCEKFGGKLPDSIEQLTTLPGIGRKTANLIMGDVFGQPAVVCDTHMIRIANRLGLVKTTDPYQVEMQLRKLLPPKESSDFCHRAVVFGREVCSARSPKCSLCELREVCIYKPKA